MTTAIIALILVLQGAAPTPGSDRAMFEQARREHQLGNYPAAAAGFSECYRRSGDPLMLFNTAQALRLAGRDTEAIAAYRGYLRERPDAPNRVLVESKIRELESVHGAPRHGPRESSELELVDPMADGRDTKPVRAAALPSAEASTAHGPPSPTWKRWWVWTAVGAVVVGGTVTAIALSHGSTNIPMTPLGNQGIFR